MKKGIFFLLLAATFTANAQSKPSLKELLYSGKLKADSNGVVRKTDDLSSKIDTSTKKVAEPVTPKEPVAVTTTTNTTATTAVEKKETPVAETASTEPVVKETPPVAAPKSTTKIWKEYIELMMGSIKSEVLPSKKIKKQSYFLTVDYEIGTDGIANIINVTSDPENAFLQDQVKERMVANPPQLTPVLDSNNQPRKVKKKYSFEVVKE